MKKRVFLIVLDSFGIGELPDADQFGDGGSNTLGTIRKSEDYLTPNMEKLGLFHIDGVAKGIQRSSPVGSYGRMAEKSMGKDTTIGHWEIAGVISSKPLPVYPNGFPDEIIQAFQARTGRKIICNRPYSGTDVIRDYGKEHVDTGALIVYTSADSVFQIAAHEGVVPLEELYHCCRIARELLEGEHGVGRVIARPFEGDYPDYKRTVHRHDFSLFPPKETMLDILAANGYDTIGIGKISDIFAGRGIQESRSIVSNTDGMKQTMELQERDFQGICFVNLVDFDMLYGHRNDIDGYARAATEFDRQLGTFLDGMKEEDILMITADHGCDPGTASTDHSREYVPFLIYGRSIRENVSLGTRESFADIAATILDIFGIKGGVDGKSFLQDVLKELKNESSQGGVK